MANRGRKMLRAMIDAAPEAGVETIVSREWQRKAPLLMSYGLGSMERFPWTDEHVRNGGRVIGWDLGYWERDRPRTFNMRMTLDDLHPHRWIRAESPERFAATGIELRDDYDPDGPIVLVGIGRKQRAWLGIGTQEWERKTLRKLRKRFGDDRDIIFRPKRPEDTPAGTRVVHGPIEDVIRGASLVVCHHSNVAVDACIAGIPVECEDGAAFALYNGNSNPTRAQRLSFLESLAHWQYHPLEAAAAWGFINKQLEASR